MRSRIAVPEPARSAIVALLFVLLLLPQTSHADDQKVPPNLPFAPGETLKYKLVWNRIPVGHFSVGIRQMTMIGGQKAWHFYMQITTNSFADRIYKVRQFANSYVSPDLNASYQYENNQRQGKTKKKVKLKYDWEKMQVHYMLDNAIDKGWKDLPNRCVDPLAMFYAIRIQDFDNGTNELSVWVSDGEKHVNSKVRIVKRERIKVNGKHYNSIMLEPDLGELHGVFKKSENAKLQIWVSDDEYKIPLKVSSKVVVGRFYANLIDFKKGDPL